MSILQSSTQPCLPPPPPMHPPPFSSVSARPPQHSHKLPASPLFNNPISRPTSMSSASTSTTSTTSNIQPLQRHPVRHLHKPTIQHSENIKYSSQARLRPAPNPMSSPTPPVTGRSSSTALPPSTVERMCANCKRTQTPLWRRSPLGPKTLCNACGVRMKKGRLIFDENTRTFITIPSPHASARRPVPRTASVAPPTARSIPAAAAPPPRPICKHPRPRPSRNSNLASTLPMGLYYLLAAIDYVETM